MLSRTLLILCLILPLSLIFHQSGVSHSPFACAADEGSLDEGADVLEGEDEANVEEAGDVVKSGEDEEEADEGDVLQLKPSPDVDSFFLITKPIGMGLELPAGKEVHFLVGFANRGKKDFHIDTMDASFRYAQDFSFHLQNFTAIAYNKLVKPQQEVTLGYQFFVSEAYSTRPYGLTVSLFYRDSTGNQYMNAVFNETVSIVELDEGLDGETFFLYVFLVACLVLVVVVGHQFATQLKRKHLGSSSKTSSKQVERGTSNPNDVDYDWLPQETINSLNKSPRTPKQSPRQRKVKRTTGSDD